MYVNKCYFVILCVFVIHSCTVAARNKKSNKLELNEDIPFVDIQEKFKNESFVAKKAVTFSEEMHVSNKAPVTKVKIKNISSQKKNKNTKSKNFSIIVGDFYARETAEDLKYTIETNYLPEGSLNIQKLSKNKSAGSPMKNPVHLT